MTRYFLTADGQGGAKIDAPTEGPKFQRLIETLRQAYPDLEEVDRETYLEAERQAETEQRWVGDPP